MIAMFGRRGIAGQTLGKALLVPLSSSARARDEPGTVLWMKWRRGCGLTSGIPSLR